jgi:hypothetical protein
MGHARSGRPVISGHETLKRFVAAGLLVALMPQLGGCTLNSATDIRPAQLKPEELGQPEEPRLVAVVTEWGRRYALDSTPVPQMRGDTLYATVDGRPHPLARAAIRRLVMARGARDTVPVATSSLGAAADVALGRRIRGLTTVTGTEVRFDSTRAVYVLADTVHAVAGGGAVQIGLPSVARLTVIRRNEALYAVSSVLAVGVAGLLVAGLISCGMGGGCGGMALGSWHSGR